MLVYQRVTSCPFHDRCPWSLTHRNESSRPTAAARRVSNRDYRWVRGKSAIGRKMGNPIAGWKILRYGLYIYCIYIYCIYIYTVYIYILYIYIHCIYIYIYIDGTCIYVYTWYIYIWFIYPF